VVSHFSAYTSAHDNTKVTDMPARTLIVDIDQTTEYRLTRLYLVRRYIGRKPLTREAQALDTAARLLVRCHLSAADPSVTPDMLCKLNAASKHAMDVLRLTAAERPRRRPRHDESLMLSVGEARP
jgi:hypothetical protein